MSRASGYFKTNYRSDLVLVETRFQWFWVGLLALVLLVFPFVLGPFGLDLANQVFLAIIGSVGLMLLSGHAGQISLGSAGLLAAGAFTTGILVKETGASIWLTLPASALVGGLLGVIFGLPSLRLKGLYLAMSTLALHFIVIFLGGEYETIRGFSTGILIDPPVILGWEFSDPRAWYFGLLLIDLAVVLFALNLVRSRTGRAWAAIRGREVAAEALGISVHWYKLSAFVVSSVLTSVAGCLFAYYHSFVSVEAFSLFLTIQYVAMVIIGGLGSILGAILGAVFVVLFPYVIEWAMEVLPVPARFADFIFAVNFASFGLIMILFLVLEPLGLVGIWHRLRDYFLEWPFRQKPLGS
ncbi:MAG: branched-chain amino acid ABC transporter permease [Alphaproteobacteria bacterium]|jgi:branched-chain amino acid transport system permease protein|nr:branched-chain amino acid ABC transporter permease [Rhodospirillaceae bacterium]MDP6406611.1 branched-chain amino acid ABC transporter permease [Alphaproteobacteria bacterium]MDP6624545.1 branched-chain amino acid ABC transporter permease [Alphaproteobacteria bacterium]|tara:strand:- start:65 stop:1126 length:1062 start_codon:yes stop_codon:yes gene_type:complete